ncbi:hypothetical protein GOP47_0025217 [Adiantum capillus-veneris]|uniref:Secreted protein n=1 Tax=Adiantum capillus-veneris TaxID=13818 RepID=A0A9D4U3M6_ADICA|nr:hypothetical protein GOP47_0025217 [Adiantum capillus-veneris]
MKGVQMTEVVAMITIVVMVMIEAREGASENHMTLEMVLVVGVVLAGSRVTGCVPGPDAVSIILQVAQNVFDAKLPGRLLHPDRSTEFSNRPINMTMGARCCHGALLT